MNIDSRAAEKPKLQYRLITILTCFFCIFLLVSNIAATQPIEFKIFSFSLILDGGFLLFPFAYILGDIISEVYGFKYAKRATFFAFAACAFSFLYLFIVCYLPKTEGWDESGFLELFGFKTPQILIASLAGFLAGQLINAYIVDRLKSRTFLISRLLSSSVAGEAADTVIFCAIASSVLQLTKPGDIAVYIILGIIYKLFIEAICLPITYMVIKYIKQYEYKI